MGFFFGPSGIVKELVAQCNSAALVATTYIVYVLLCDGTGESIERDP